MPPIILAPLTSDWQPAIDKTTMSKEEKTPPFVHPHKTVYVLIPVDATEAEAAKTEINKSIDKLPDEQKPFVVQQIKLGMLPANTIIYVASRAPGKRGAMGPVRVSEPIHVSNFSVQRMGDPDGSAGVNIGALTDEIQKHTKFCARLSAEKEPYLKTVKLFQT